MILMNNVSDLNNYKRSKIIVKDLTTALGKLSSAIKDLSPYKKYVPIKGVLIEMVEARMFIDLHLKKHKEIVKNKGFMLEEDKLEEVKK
jgi:hypothetical protein